MHKLLPFRQYDEKDVINLFKLNLGGQALTALKPNSSEFEKKNWSGTAVTVDTSNDWYATDPAGLHTSTHSAQSYLGAIGTDDQGNASKFGSFYPEAPMAVEATSESGGFLGLTLRATLAYDENDEKLSSYPVKKDELQAVLPGEAVPVVTRGFFTLTINGITGSDPGKYVHVNDHGVLKANTTAQGAIGKVLAVGDASGTKPSAIFVQITG